MTCIRMVESKDVILKIMDGFHDINDSDHLVRSQQRSGKGVLYSKFLSYLWNKIIFGFS